MSLSIVMAVTASCALYMTVAGKRGPQGDMVDLSAHKKKPEPQMPHPICNKSPRSHAEISSRTHLEISLWSSVP